MFRAWKSSLLTLASIVYSAPTTSQPAAIVSNSIARTNSSSSLQDPDPDHYLCSSPDLRPSAGMYRCFITGGPQLLMALVTFPKREMHITVDLANLFNTAASASDQMKEMSELTGNAHIPGPDPTFLNGDLCTLAFEQDQGTSDVGIYVAGFPCHGHTLMIPPRIAPMRYSDVSMALEGLMALMDNIASSPSSSPGRGDVGLVLLSYYTGYVGSHVDPALISHIGGLVWQSKFGERYLQEAMRIYDRFECDDEVEKLRNKTVVGAGMSTARQLGLI